MADPSTGGCLPPGWTVEVRVRKNGKRDKYYFSPSNGLKFNSMVEVFRHLDNVQNEVSIQRISDNVVVEKGIAEGLPAGWMRKTRITTKGDTVRRDSYYIDPVSGYVFRSIKEVDRYLESGVIRRNAFKPKVKDSSDMELKDNKFSSAAGVTMKPTLSISLNQSLKPTLSINLGQSSGLDMTANHQQIPRAASSGEYTPMPISQHISSQCVVGTDFTSLVLSRAASSDQKEREAGLAESALVSGCTTESQEKQQENSETKHGTEKAQVQNRQRKNKKDINLPRRASKRLAGIKVDPLPELKTRNRPRRAAVKQSDEEETITDVDKSPNSLPNGLKQFNTLEDGTETKCKSEGTKNTMQSPELGQMRVLENRDNNDAKLNYTRDFPLREILTDPCIAFAIQTLTGVSFETSKNSQISSELRNSQHCETPSAAAEGHDKKINVLGHDSSGCNVFPSPENFANPQAHAGDAKVVGKANENLGSSSENTLDISWMDPCIEFAIKTLTGTIPLDTDQNPKKCLQQSFNSSNSEHSEMALSSVSLDNSCQSDYYCNQYFGTQKPMFNQSFVDPTLQHTRNIGIGNSAGARLPHYGEDRRNVC